MNDDMVLLKEEPGDEEDALPTVPVSARAIMKIRRRLHQAKFQRDDALFKTMEKERQIKQLRIRMQEKESILVVFNKFREDYNKLLAKLSESEQICQRQQDLIDYHQQSLENKTVPSKKKKKRVSIRDVNLKDTMDPLRPRSRSVSRHKSLTPAVSPRSRAKSLSIQLPRPDYPKRKPLQALPLPSSPRISTSAAASPRSSRVVRKKSLSPTASGATSPRSSRVARKKSLSPTASGATSPRSSRVARKKSLSPTASGATSPRSSRVARKKSLSPTASAAASPRSSRVVRKKSLSPTASGATSPRSSRVARKKSLSPTASGATSPRSSRVARKKSLSPTASGAASPRYSRVARKRSPSPTASGATSPRRSPTIAHKGTRRGGTRSLSPSGSTRAARRSAFFPSPPQSPRTTTASTRKSRSEIPGYLQHTKSSISKASPRSHSSRRRSTSKSHSEPQGHLQHTKSWTSKVSQSSRASSRQRSMSEPRRAVTVAQGRRSTKSGSLKSLRTVVLKPSNKAINSRNASVLKSSIKNEAKKVKKKTVTAKKALSIPATKKNTPTLSLGKRGAGKTTRKMVKMQKTSSSLPAKSTTLKKKSKKNLLTKKNISSVVSSGITRRKKSTTNN